MVAEGFTFKGKSPVHYVKLIFGHKRLNVFNQGVIKNACRFIV